jgi:hypothetical protein
LPHNPFKNAGRPLTRPCRQLENKLTQLGYECVLREGLNMVRCLADASPIVQQMASPADKVKWMDRVYTTTVFGALDRFDNPIANLLSAAKRAATMQSDPFTTMIVPSGLMELQRYAKAENVYYYLSGQAKDKMEPVKFGLDGGLHDPATNLNIFVHYPRVDYSSGTAYGKASNGDLFEKVKIKVFYPLDTKDKTFYMNAATGEATKVEGTDGDLVEYECLMSSAILAAGGSRTGELLMAYPQTSVNTIATSPEMMKLQLRVYLGACLYNPQNVMVVPHCKFEGVIIKKKTKIGAGVDDDKTFGDMFAASSTKDGPFPFTIKRAPTATKDDDLDDKGFRSGALVYRGATYNKKTLKDDTLISPNNGHFGSLDCPAGYSKLHGMAPFRFRFRCPLLPLTRDTCARRPERHGGHAPHTLDSSISFKQNHKGGVQWPGCMML